MSPGPSHTDKTSARPASGDSRVSRDTTNHPTQAHPSGISALIPRNTDGQEFGLGFLREVDVSCRKRWLNLTASAASVTAVSLMVMFYWILAIAANSGIRISHSSERRAHHMIAKAIGGTHTHTMSFSGPDLTPFSLHIFLVDFDLLSSWGPFFQIVCCLRLILRRNLRRW